MRFKSLRSKLSLLYALTIIVPVVIMMIAMPLYYSKLITRETSILTSAALTSMASNVETYLGDLDRLTMAPYMNDEVMRALKLKASGQYDTASDYAKYMADNALYKTLPNYLTNVRTDILNTILLPFDGSAFVRSNYGPAALVSGYSFEQQTWYQEALKANGNTAFISPHPQDYLLNSSAPQVFSVARLIKDTAFTERPLAVMMADADTVVLKRITENIRFNVSSIVTILDGKDMLIYSDHVVPESFVRQITTGQSTIKWENTKYVTVSKTIPKANWKITVLLSYPEIQSKVRWIYLVGIGFAAGGLALTLLLFFQLSKWIINPFQEMIKVVRRVQKGNLNEQISIHGEDEVSQLGVALNTMIVRLKEFINREYKAKLNLRNAEFRALQSQIEPHFLYNTLNGFIGLNRSGDKKVLEKAILSLSNLLRYTLDHKDQTFIKDEFTFLERYCELQKLRFQERLNYSVEVDPSIGYHTMPKLLLQPLVENAIIHGIEPSDKPCNLSIKGELLGDDLIISIRDDGVGFDRSRQRQHESVGLKNVQERLDISYGGLARFEITSAPGEGTEIAIHIPLQEENPPEEKNKEH